MTDLEVVERSIVYVGPMIQHGRTLRNIDSSDSVSGKKSSSDGRFRSLKRSGPRTWGVQSPIELIDVGVWTADGDVGHGAATRNKQWLISPARPEFEFVRPTYRHMLKSGIARAPDQYWNEILAYRLGHYMGISVPPTHVAYNSLTREAGALSEFFDYTAHAGGQSRFRSGSEVLALRSITERRDGRDHNFEAVSGWFTFLERNRLMLDDWRDHWAQAFLLDSLIGNTDRHIDNWGALETTTRLGKTRFRLAPLFDNGTSMGYELPVGRLDAMFREGSVPRYINKGTHQMFWRRADAARLSHPQFLKRFYDEFPGQRSGIESRLQVSDRTLERLLQELTQFRSPIPLNVDRARLMLKLLKFRRDHLKETIFRRGPTLS